METIEPTAHRHRRPTGAPAPLVSVVLPTRDRPERVVGALDSILAQSYENLQVIVVDDGSAEPVADLVAPWLHAARRIGRQAAPSEARRLVELVRLPLPVGAAGARNAGLARARGDLVAFLDDDDRWERTKVAQQVAFFERHPEHGLVSCYCLAVEETSARPPRVVRTPANFTAAQLLWANFVGGFSQVMLRRSRLGGDISIDEGYRSVEDWDLWLRCAQLAPVATVSRPLVHYVAHTGPRLSDPLVKRSGLERFYESYSHAMSPSCRSFHEAHIAMEASGSLRRRVAVARALAGSSPPAWPVLIGEQLARQAGRMVGDPGLALRLLAAITHTQSQTHTQNHTGTGHPVDLPSPCPAR